jgi:hypothetical protein
MYHLKQLVLERETTAAALAAISLDKRFGGLTLPFYPFQTESPSPGSPFLFPGWNTVARRK